MLEVNTHSENGKGTIELIGELDTTSSVEFEKSLDGFLDDLTDLTIDMKKLDYITSAGLRVLLYIEQTMEDQGEMVVRNLTEPVRQVIELVGFDSAFNIE